MNKSNFEKVVEFNKTFGVTLHNSVQNNIFDEDKKLVDLRLSLITEEVDELKEAIKNKDMTETIDALADILYVVYGAGASFGINLDIAMDLVHESNMSKLCDTEELAKKTVNWYIEKYNKGELPYDLPSYRKDDKTNKYIVFNKSTGKILKSIEYKPVDLKNFSHTI